MTAVQTLVLACRLCGQAVADPDPRDVVEVAVTGVSDAEGHVHPHRMPSREQLTTCGSCQDVVALADDILSELPPRAVARLGGGAARSRVLAALVGVLVSGSRLPASFVAEEVVGLAEAMAQVGGLAAWSHRVSPVRATQRPPTRAWDHLDADDRAAAREHYGRWLHARLATQRGPVRLEPPPRPRALSAAVVGVGLGCLFCGLAAVEWSAARVEAEGGLRAARLSAWTPRTVGGSSLGWRGTPMAAGWLCPECSAAVEAVGSVGPTSVERAWRTATGQTVDGYAQSRMDDGDRTAGLVPWGRGVLRALHRGKPVPPPNEVPWAHVEGVGDGQEAS